MNVLHTTTANATGDGRNGDAELEDASLAFDVRIPAAMGGPGTERVPVEVDILRLRFAATTTLS